MAQRNKTQQRRDQRGHKHSINFSLNMPTATDPPCQEGSHDDSDTKSNANPIDVGHDIGALKKSAISMLPGLPIDIEDEVSWVVHKFRYQSSPIHSIDGNIVSKKRKKKVYRGYFSDVRYHSKASVANAFVGETQKRPISSNGRERSIPPGCGRLIEVSYLFDKVVSLTFHIRLRIVDHSDDGENDCKNRQDDSSKHKNFYTTFVTFVDDEDDAACLISRSLAIEQWSVLRARLRSICDALNSNHPEKTNSSSSLFAVLSKLLLFLNQLQTEVLDPNNDARSDPSGKAENSIPHPLTDREKNSYLEGLFLLGGRSSSDLPSSGDATRSLCPGGVDLAILLLRCAAMGKHREVFSRPFPLAAGCDSIAESIWKATEYHLRFQRRRRRQRYLERQRSNSTAPHDKTKRNGNTLSKSPMSFPPSEQEFLGFLFSLPWMKRGRITVTKTRGLSETNGTKSRDGRRMLFEVCLQLCGDDDDDDGTNGDASYSPRFVRSCHKHGVLTVFHGTHMENVWSILNNCFWNLSEVGRGEFVKNGAMLGSGIYLSTSQKVATFFATSNAPARTVRAALNNNDSVTNLLSLAGAWNGTTPGAVDEPGAGTVSFGDRYEISCFPVFEARIARPPGNEEDSSPDRSGRPKQKNSNDTTVSTTRRDGKYYVVPDGRDVRITKLHLTFELKTKGSKNYYNALSNFLSAVLGEQSLALVFFWLVVSVVLFWCRAGGTSVYRPG